MLAVGTRRTRRDEWGAYTHETYLRGKPHILGLSTSIGAGAEITTTDGLSSEADGSRGDSRGLRRGLALERGLSFGAPGLVETFEYAVSCTVGD